MNVPCVPCPRCTQQLLFPSPETHPVICCPTCDHEFTHPAKKKFPSIVPTVFCLLALCCWAPGIFWEIVRTEKFDFVRGFSVNESMQELFTRGHLLLGTIVFLASIALPFLKCVFIPVFNFLPKSMGHAERKNWRRFAHLIHSLVEFTKNWSWLDVAAVSVLVCAVQLGAFAQVVVGPALWFFGAYVIFSLLASCTFSPSAKWKAMFSANGIATDTPIVAKQGSNFPKQLTLSGIAITLCALLLSACSYYFAPFVLVEVHWSEVDRLKVGDFVLMDGHQCGRVTQIYVAKPDDVVVSLKIEPDSVQTKWLACEGAKYWLEEPTIDAAGISGMGSITRRVVRVLPGDGVDPCFRFLGLNEKPIEVDIPKNYVEIHLTATRKGNIKLRSPVVSNLGSRIGLVTGLEEDNRSVKLRLHVQNDYAAKITSSTVFARSGQFGFEVEGGKPRLELPGLELITGEITIFTSSRNPGEKLKDFSAKHFPLMDHLPVEAKVSAEAIYVKLHAADAHNLRAGSSIVVRGIPVGVIGERMLKDDGSIVEAPAYIFPEWRHLVKKDSKLWYDSAVKVTLGLGNVSFNIPSAEGFLSGAVALNTLKDSKGAPIEDGDVLFVHGQAEEKWIK